MSFALQKGFFICVMTPKKNLPVLLYFTVTRMTWKYNLPHSAFRLEILCNCKQIVLPFDCY